MFRSPWRTFLVLASVILVALFSGHSLKQVLLISSSDNVVFVWSFLTVGIAFSLGVLLSRKFGQLTAPLVLETEPDRSAASYCATCIPPAAIEDAPHAAERALELSGPEPETSEEDEKSSDGPALNAAAAEDEAAEAAAEELSDAGDEDMQPHAGDADRLTTIVKGLDELARAQALGRALQKQPIELAPYLNNVIENTRASVQNKAIAFNLECGSNLRLSIDPACLMGIMSNLIENAAKAVKKEGTVTVSAAAQGDHVVIAVRDTGSGISRKALPHIFERFYRGSGNGIGLGLTIVQELVQACEATIKVETTRGKGSIFTVCIPSLQQELF
ncbi:MAG: HAMP domain-containing sensor histidine kinase [Nitrospiraceae bacterium]|nr:HAMP domain-containing sensor histidine kinase [Nitrospiraceae bacterium]